MPFFLTQKKKLRQPGLLGPSVGAGPSDRAVAGPCVRQLWHRTIGNRQRWRGHSLQRRLLERQLLMAVSPWVGDIVLPCTPRRPAAAHTRGTALGPLREPPLRLGPLREPPVGSRVAETQGNEG